MITALAAAPGSAVGRVGFGRLGHVRTGFTVVTGGSMIQVSGRVRFRDMVPLASRLRPLGAR